MLDAFFLMMAIAVNSVPGDVSSGSAQIAAQIAAQPVAPATQAPGGAQTAAAPSFLAPAPNSKPTTPATSAPAFLAPKADKAAAPPAFLTPAAKPALVAEPQTPSGRFTTATEVKPILNATKANWIHVREFDGKDLLYVTHLWSWRCGLLEMRVGINGNDPEVWPLPDCHLDLPSPAAMLDSDGLPYRRFGLNAIAMIEVEITYDDLSTDQVKFNRQGVVIP